MNPTQSRTIVVVIIAVLAAWLVFPLLFSRREQVLPLSHAPLSFEAQEAYRVIQEFVTQFPRRVLGSLESRQSTGYLHDYLEKLGYAITYSHFDARIARRREVGRNVLAYKEGQSREILALIAHLDTAKTTVQGAMDNGSGVGVLLELARAFSVAPTRHSLLLIFSDGEEWGMLGARDLAENYPDRNRIAVVLSLDHVAIGDLGAFCLEETGQLNGFTPPWLRQLTREAARAQGLSVIGASGISEYLDRAVLVSWADQGPFLAEGIPAINLGSESKEPERERQAYHSARDTIDNLKPASIRDYGLAAERLVRTLDELPSIPKGSQGALRVRDARFMESGAVAALQIVSFVPLLLIFWFHLTDDRKITMIGVVREFLAFLGTVLPLAMIYFLIAICRLRLLPLYTLYPATPKDPVLENPSWGILAGIFGTALFIAAVCYVIAKFSFQSLPKPDFHVSKIVLLALMLIEVGFALSYNAYWASFFLLLPAWIWAITGRGQKSSSRAMNRVLIIAAGIPYYAALWIFASKLYMHWNFIWYQVLALSSGLFTKAAFFLAAAVIAVGIRFLAVQSHESQV